MDNNKLHIYEKVIKDFLKFLNHKSQDFALKGRTALVECYNLNKEFDNIELDSKKGGRIFAITRDFCNEYKYEYNILKDTYMNNTVSINYGVNNKPLIIDVSLRIGFKESNTIVINEIKTYYIDKLANLELDSFNRNSTVKDAYDIAFIYNEYKEKLSYETIQNMKDCVLYKGLEYLDFLIENKTDELINKEEAEKYYLKMYYDMECDAISKNEYNTE